MTPNRCLIGHDIVHSVINTYQFYCLEARMVEMSSMGIGNKPCLDIRPSADQISDRSISFAQLTRSK